MMRGESQSLWEALPVREGHYGFVVTSRLGHSPGFRRAGVWLGAAISTSGWGSSPRSREYAVARLEDPSRVCGTRPS